MVAAHLGTPHRPLLRLALVWAALAWAAPLGLSLPATALAHIEVVPGEAGAGETVRYGIRVPTERPIPTVRVEVQFPERLRVLDFETSPGWQLSVQHDPAGRPLGAIWDGGSIPTNQFAEFGLRARNPDAETALRWSVIQTYQDGSEVQWDGSPNAEFPSATTHVSPQSGAHRGEIVAWVGLVVAIAAAVIAAVSWRAAHAGSRGNAS